MKPKELSKSQLAVLKQINETIPKGWLKQLTRKTWAHPALRALVDQSLNMLDTLSPDKFVDWHKKNNPDMEFGVEDIPRIRDKLLALKASKEYSLEEEVMNEEIEKKIDSHLTMKVRQAIKKGALPPLSKENYAIRATEKEGIA